MITSLSLVVSLAFLLGCQDNTAVANLSKPATTPAAAKPAATPPPEKPAGDGKHYNSAAEVPRISVEEAKKSFDAGEAVFVDSRPEPAYKAEHILGAISIPSGANASEKFSSLPKGKKIIVYCSWPAEGTSASLALQMNQKGIPDTHALVGGTQAWKSAGHPMKKAE